jgi:hypothetical protein
MNTDQTVLRLRQEVVHLCDASIALVVECMYEVLPSSIYASTILLGIYLYLSMHLLSSYLPIYLSNIVSTACTSM